MARALAVALLLTLVTSVVHAQPRPEDRMMAQALFDDAIKLMAEDNFEEACPKFEESHRLDPGIGVRFRLADCYEQAGRLSRSWILFIDVAAAARSAGQEQRAAAARRRAAELEPRLSKLRVDVIEPTAELVVTRNGQAVSRAQWGTLAPVEVGDHVIEARATGHKPWRTVVNVVGEGNIKSVTVPALEELPPPPPATVAKPRKKPKDTGDETSGADIRRAFGIGLGVLGVVGIGVGIGAGIVAIGKKSEADEHCPMENECFQRGLTLRDEASDAAALSTVGFAIGVPAVAGGLILWLTADEADEPNEKSSLFRASATRKAFEIAPLAGPGVAGLLVGGTF